MSDNGLRWNLLEKYGLIGIKAPSAPPSRYTGSGEASALWRQIEQEGAEWKALFVAAQRRVTELTAELATRAICGPVKHPVDVEKHKARQRTWVAAGCCRQCGRKRERQDRIRCEMCAYKNRVDCLRRWHAKSLTQKRDAGARRREREATPDALA